ncbi:MAG TPA: LptF/LptG family permease [Aestuariivirgaceae bacterium]|jgi:lipopolysaccharide export system permease protein
MAVVDRYILKQIAKPLLTAIAIGMLVLLAERMVRLLDVTLGKRNSFGLVFELLGYLLPHYLGFAIPVALFLGLMFGVNKLSRDSEIDAFLAAGIGIQRLIAPIVVLSLLVACLSFAIFGWLQPHARYAYRAVLFTARNVEVFYLAEEGVFMQAGNRTFILDKLSRSDGSFQKIFLFEDRGEKGAETITATRGRLISDPGEQRPVLHLEQGHRLGLPAQPEFAATAEAPSALVGDFAFADTPLGRIKEKFTRLRGIDERELTLPELYTLRDSPPKNATPEAMRAELHHRMINILVPVILPFLALPFALGRRRRLRAYRFGVAVALLIAFHEIVQQGFLMTQKYGYSPYLTMWTPFALMSAFAAWRFKNVCFSVRSDRFEPFFDWLAALMRSVRDRILPQPVGRA